MNTLEMEFINTLSRKEKTAEVLDLESRLNEMSIEELSDLVKTAARAPKPPPPYDAEYENSPARKARVKAEAERAKRIPVHVPGKGSSSSGPKTPPVSGAAKMGLKKKMLIGAGIAGAAGLGIAAYKKRKDKEKLSSAQDMVERNRARALELVKEAGAAGWATGALHRIVGSGLGTRAAVGAGVGAAGGLLSGNGMEGAAKGALGGAALGAASRPMAIGAGSMNNAVGAGIRGTMAAGGKTALKSNPMLREGAQQMAKGRAPRVPNTSNATKAPKPPGAPATPPAV